MRYTALTAAIMLLSSSMAWSDTPETRRYLGVWEGSVAVDGDLEYLSQDVDVDGNPIVTVRISNWVPTDTNGVFRLVGDYSIKGEISISTDIGGFFSISEDYDIDETRTITEEDNILLDLNDLSIDNNKPLDVPDLGDLILDLDFSDRDRITGETSIDVDDLDDNLSGEITLFLNLGRLNVSPEDEFAQPRDPFDLELNLERLVRQLVFDFDFNDEEWTYRTVDGFQGGEGEYDPLTGGLRIDIPDDDQVFSYFEGPMQTLPKVADQANLLEVRWTVGSTVPVADLSPVNRLRTSRSDYQQTSEMWISSTGDGDASPSLLSDRDYRQYVALQPGSKDFRHFWDMLNFGGDDASAGRVWLRSLAVTDLGAGYLTNSREEATYDFADSTEGFTSNFPDDGQYVAPEFAATEEGLVMTGRGDGTPQIGFWELPRESATVELDPSRLYRARYYFTTDATEANREGIPTFRARLNETSFQTAAVTLLESVNGSNVLPVDGNMIAYDVYMQVPPQVTDSKLLLSFDLIFLESQGNEAGVSVILDRIEVESFELPED